MVTPHLPWKFHANRSNRFLVILLTKKQRKKDTYIHTYIHTNKEIDRKQYPVPRSIGDKVKSCSLDLCVCVCDTFAMLDCSVWFANRARLTLRVAAGVDPVKNLPICQVITRTTTRSCRTRKRARCRPTQHCTCGHAAQWPTMSRFYAAAAAAAAVVVYSQFDD